eukprot:PITA_23673
MKVALSLADRGLIGQFTGLWPSPKTTEKWVNRNWVPLINQSVTSYFLGQGYFLFEFTSKEDKDLIFRNGPYFMGPQGLYLNKWTSDFDPAVDVPKVVPVWVRLPNLPVHCWNLDSLIHIGNSLGKFIDRASNKDRYDCAKICVEVDLEVGLPEVIKIKVSSWSHVQILDYEQLTFKCNIQANAQRHPTKKAQENKFDPVSQPTEGIPEVETQKPVSLSKGTLPASPKEVENPKGVALKDEEEEQETDELEEGEIGESQTSIRRSTRGRKKDKEKREQQTYKDKLQGSQPTLEKLLDSKPKMVKNQPQGSKGAH